MALKAKNSRWKFSLHLDATKGPNRVTHDPSVAEKFYKRLVAKNPKANTLAIVTHMPSNLVWETDDPLDLSYFIHRIVDHTGVIYNGK